MHVNYIAYPRFRLAITSSCLRAERLHKCKREVNSREELASRQKRSRDKTMFCAEKTMFHAADGFAERILID